jgi:hypothetical protein
MARLGAARQGVVGSGTARRGQARQGKVRQGRGSMTEANIFTKGLPTDFEIRKLTEHFTDIQSLRGSTIKHEELERVTGLKRDTSRYKTVVVRWRKKVARETGIEIRGDLRGDIGVGIRVLSASEQLEYSGDLDQHAGRKVRHSHRAVANIADSDLTEQERKIKDHRILAAKHVYSAMIESRQFRSLAPGPPEMTPKVMAKDKK